MRTASAREGAEQEADPLASPTGVATLQPMPRLRPVPPPFTGSILPPNQSPLPRFTTPTDESVRFDRATAEPEHHVLEVRPKGERLLVHCFAGDTPRSIGVAVHPGEAGLSRVRVSLGQSIADALARLADLTASIAEGTIFDATLVVRPGFRVIGPTGSPLANQLVISDLPHLGGELIIGRPYAERRAMLEELLEALNQPSLISATELRPLGAEETSLSTPRGMLLVMRDLRVGYTPRPVPR